MLSTAMKSVGEVMAIGRNFHESLQKALRGLETGLIGLNGVRELYGAPRDGDRGGAGHADARPAAGRRPGAARRASRVAEIHAITHYDPWFLERIEEIVEAEEDDLPRRPAERRRRACGG